MITLILRKKLTLKQRCFLDGTLYVKIPKKSTENILSVPVSVLKNTDTENSISVFLSTDTDTEIPNFMRYSQLCYLLPSVLYKTLVTVQQLIILTTSHALNYACNYTNTPPLTLLVATEMTDHPAHPGDDGGGRSIVPTKR